MDKSEILRHHVSSRAFDINGKKETSLINITNIKQYVLLQFSANEAPDINWK